MPVADDSDSFPTATRKVISLYGNMEPRSHLEFHLGRVPTYQLIPTT